MAVKRNTFIVVPPDVTDSVQLHRFLSRLVEQLDVAFGNRADNPFTTLSSVTQISNELEQVTTKVVSLEEALNLLDIRVEQVEILSKDIDTRLSVAESEIQALENLQKQSTIADSSLTTITRSSSYNQAEAQQVANQVISLQTKLNLILNSLRLSKILTSP